MDRSQGGSSLGMALVIIVLVGLAGWYLYSMSANSPSSPDQDQPVSQVIDDSDAAVANDLGQVPDDSALDQDAANLDKDIQGL